MIKVSKEDVGRFVRVKYDCVGARDGVCVYISDDRKTCKVFEFRATEVSVIDANQIVSFGNYLGALNTGL